LKIKRIIWLEETIEKLSYKHGIAQGEVREILDSKPYIRFVEKGHRKDENVYSAMGQTNDGRYLIIFFIYKKDNQALILSAREMTKTERRRYGKR